MPRFNFFKNYKEFTEFTDNICGQIISSLIKNRSAKKKFAEAEANAFEKIQQIAVLATIGLLPVEDLKKSIIKIRFALKENEIESSLNDDNELANKLSHVLNEELISELSILFMSDDFQNWLTLKNIKGEKIIRNPMYLYREDDKTSIRLIDKLYESEKNKKFTDQFLVDHLLPRLILPIAQSMAIAIALNKEYDYTKYDAEITRMVMTEVYYDALILFKNNFNLVPTQMKQGASLVYQGLKPLLETLKEKYNVSDSIDVILNNNTIHKTENNLNTSSDFSAMSSNENENTLNKTKANRFLVNLVGIYLNLNLLRRSFVPSVNIILQLPPDDLLKKITDAFYKGKKSNGDFTSDQSQLFKDELIALLAKNKITDVILKNQLEEVLKIPEKAFLIELNKFITEHKDSLNMFANKEMIDSFPNLSRHVLLLTHWPMLMGTIRNVFNKQIRGLNVTIEYGLVQNFSDYIENCDLTLPAKKKTSDDNNSNNNFSSSSNEQPISELEMLRESLKSDVKEKYLNDILSFYAMMSVSNNLLGKKHARYPVKLYFNLETILAEMPKATVTSKDEYDLVLQTFNNNLTKIINNKLEYIAKKILSTSDVPQDPKVQAKKYLDKVKDNLLEIISIVSLKKDACKSKVSEMSKSIMENLQNNFQEKYYERNDQKKIMEVLALLACFALIFNKEKLMEKITNFSITVQRTNPDNSAFKLNYNQSSNSKNDLNSAIKAVFNVEGFEKLKEKIQNDTSKPTIARSSSY